MQEEPGYPVVLDLTNGVVRDSDVDGIGKIIPKQHRPDANSTDNHRGNRQCNQWPSNHPGAFVAMLAGVLIHACVAMKDQKKQAEAVQCRYKYAD